MNEDNPAPSSFQSVEQPQNQHKKRIESYIFTIICWLMTLAIWTFIFLVIYISLPEPKITMENFYKIFHNVSIKKRKKLIYIIVFLIIYIIYIILEFSSPLFKYLYNIKKHELYKEMRKFFTKKPSFNIKCKYIPNEPEFKFRYISFRDISGLFEINISNNNKDKKNIFC